MSQADARMASGKAIGASARIVFLDNLRYLMIALVVLYHAVAAYANVAPHWQVHDTSSLAADVVRELLDVFMMPVLFFAAGYFALPSLVKRGTWAFLKDKATRLLAPWALCVLVVVPLFLYSAAVNPVRPFWRYWLWYVGSFETQLRLTQAPQGPTTQAVYWFISLLFAFFVLFALAYAVTRRWQSRAALPAARTAASTGSPLAALALFGVLTSVGYFAALLLVPDSSWFTLSAFLEFQVTRLVPYAGFFALGVYAQSRGWFLDGKPLGRIAPWAAICVVLTAAYLVIGQPVFADTAGTQSHPVGLLLAFAFIRSFLLLSLLVVLVSVGVRHWNRSTRLDRRLSETSYNVYLTHFWFVIVLQEALLEWAGGPVLAKVGIVFLAAFALSYALSRWAIGRYPRATMAAILALFAFCLVVRP